MRTHGLLASKSIVPSSADLSEVKNFEEHGISGDKISIDFTRTFQSAYNQHMLSRVVDELTSVLKNGGVRDVKYDPIKMAFDVLMRICATKLYNTRKKVLANAHHSQAEVSALEEKKGKINRCRGRRRGVINFFETCKYQIHY